MKRKKNEMNAKERYQAKLASRSLGKTLKQTFGSLIIGAILVVFISYLGLQLTGHLFRQMVSGPLALSARANEIETSINKLETSTYDAVLGNKDAASYLEDTELLVSEIQSGLTDLEAAVQELDDEITSNGILPCISAMNSAVTDYEDYAEHIADLIADGELEKAASTFSTYNEEASAQIDDELSAIYAVLENKQQLYVTRVNMFLYLSNFFIIVASLGCVITGYLVVREVTRFIITNVDQIVAGMAKVSQGDLGTHIDMEGNNEFVTLANSFNETVSNINVYIEKENEVLAQMAERDMTAAIDIDFAGDFAPMKNAVNDITARYNEFLLSSQNAADDVSGAADGMASISQTLASASTEQAASVEELLAIIENLNDTVKKVADSASDMSNVSKENNEQVHMGNEKMQDLLTAMEHIEETSHEIAGIIGMIDQIATQTNLLSLNASIEAARAGDQGRGFAVVASEIRALSEASSEAAHKISDLIETSLTAVNNGAAITRNTAELFEAIVRSGEDHTQMTHAISLDCASQTETLQSVLSGVQEISSTVVTNSALAEEASAASQELLASAETLLNELQLFKLRNATAF